MDYFNIKSKIVYKLIIDEYGVCCYASLNQKAIGETTIPLSIDSADALNEFFFDLDEMYLMSIKRVYFSIDKYSIMKSLEMIRVLNKCQSSGISVCVFIGDELQKKFRLYCIDGDNTFMPISWIRGCKSLQ